MKNTEDIATLEELAKMKRKISPDREITLPVSLANVDSRLDLFFAPEKKEDWLNLYKDENGRVAIGTVYPIESEESAKKIASADKDYVATCKITWEE